MIVVSWDGHTEINDGVNCNAHFETHFGLPPLEPVQAERYRAAPVITGVKFTDHSLPPLQIEIVDTPNRQAVQIALHRWFDGKNGVARPLVIRDDDGERERVIYALPISLTPYGGTAGNAFVAILKPDGQYDPHYRYRDVEPVEQALTITANGQIETILNDGDDETYPVIELTPTGAQASQYAYKRWVPVVWRSINGTNGYYPIELTNGGLNTQALVTAGKMQADGDDLAVIVDGQFVPRYLAGMNTTLTKIWARISFQQARSLVLAETIPASGDIDYIQIEIGSGADRRGMTRYPAAGVLLIGGEAFSYTGKADKTGQFTGITRAIKGTSAAGHAAGAAVHWVQHDVYILYGKASAAYALDEDNGPIFDLSLSSNEAWHYTTLGNAGFDREGWWYYRAYSSVIFYSDNPPVAGPTTEPWPWAGIGVTGTNAVDPYYGELIIRNACGIASIGISAGHIYRDSAIASDDWQLGFYHLGALIDSQAAPGTADSFVAWTKTVLCTDSKGFGAAEVRMRLTVSGLLAAGFEAYAGINTAALGLDTDQTPVVTLGSEQSNYVMDMTITYLGGINAWGDNQVTDGSFEAGTDGWSENGTDGFYERQTAEVYVGQYALAVYWYGVEPTEPPSYARSNYIPVGGTGALISFAAKPGTTGYGQGTVAVQWVTGAAGSVVKLDYIGFPTGSGWSVKRVVLKKPTGANGLRLVVGQPENGVWGEDRYCYLDDFRVYAGQFVEPPYVGDGVEISSIMELDATLQIDTETQQVTYLADSTRQGQAVSLLGRARQFWLPLVHGYTSWKFTGAEFGSVTANVVYRQRYYF